MFRNLFFSAIILFSLLQFTPVSGQTKKIEEMNLQYTMPGDKWVMITNNKAGNVSLTGYQREAVNGDKTKPSISFMFEQLAEKPSYSHDYFIAKVRQMGLKPSRFYSSGDKIKIGIVGGYLCKALFNARGVTDSVYFGCVVLGSKAVTFICEAPVNSFHNYDEEFISFLASVNYAGSSSSTNSPLNKDKQAVQDTRPPASQGAVIKMCDYFPLVDRMQFTYKRTNMTGVHMITEVYNPSREKVLKNGTALKGFRIKSTEQNRNNTVMYYYCENGSVNMYAEMPGYDTHISGYKEDYSIFPSDYNKPDYKKTPIWETEKYGTGKYLSFTELKSGSVGDHWTDVQEVNGNPVIISSKIIEADIPVTAGGKTYTSVIHIQRTVKIKYEGETLDLNTQDVYYAKGVGKIKAIEKGEDLIAGSYTTTEELVSSNLIKN